MEGDNHLHLATSTKPEDLRKKIKTLLTEAKVEALLCTDFESAIMATRIAYEEKVKVPEDLKLIGYISREVAQFLTPSLSYIEQHPIEVGSTAMEILNKRLEGKYESGKFEERIIATSLVHLESTKF